MTRRPRSINAIELGARIRARREALGLSQPKLAERCDVHWTFLGQAERGQRDIRMHNLLKIAAGLGVDPGELVKGLKPIKEKEPIDIATPK
jgi:transcriptional regulator with XRE-family HTH domain